MNKVELMIKNYIFYCKYQKNLSNNTLKAYGIDIQQFFILTKISSISRVNTSVLERYISILNRRYQPRTVRRKIATLRSFFSYLKYKNKIRTNPFDMTPIHLNIPLNLPKTIPIDTVHQLLSHMYYEYSIWGDSEKGNLVLRDIVAVEILFSTGIRIFELCSITLSDINLSSGIIRIKGKGNKERFVQITNPEVLDILNIYYENFKQVISNSFLVSPIGSPISEQSIRRSILKYCKAADIDLHITPHMFRHTFATSLLDAGVDIRYIQHLLGHSSISTTEIYTHVTTAKERSILTLNHPRNTFDFSKLL